MKKRILIISILLLAVILCACGAKQPQTAEVSFNSNPSTGYTWYAFQSSDLFEITSECTQDSNESNLVGVGGQQHFVLKPVKAGSCEVTFVYQRPEEAIELGDSYSYQITVTKNMQIKVNGGTAQITGETDVLPEVPELIVK